VAPNNNKRRKGEIKYGEPGGGVESTRKKLL
jgi:hypothetical protein